MPLEGAESDAVYSRVIWINPFRTFALMPVMYNLEQTCWMSLIRH